MEAALLEIQSLPTSQKGQKYKDLITQFVSTESTSSLKALLDYLLTHENVIYSRPALSFLANEITKLGSEAFREVGEYALEKGHTQSQAFEEAEYVIREHLFDVLKKDECYKEAATILAGLNLDSVSRSYTNAEKAEIYVKIAETYLVEDEAVDAEAFVNRASGLMEAVTDYWVQLRYRVTYAKVLDANRKFLEAAMRYYELSQTQRQEIPQEELLTLLGKSVTCAILGKAGPQRSRILGTLHKDERKNSLETINKHGAHAKVLEKMYMEQILTRKEMSEFAECLQDHQKVTLADGFTILEKAIIEHNMVAASKVYDNIRFSELGNLLEVEGSKAEKVAARMIGEGRLKGSMDQVDGILQFESDGDMLQTWDEKISNVCKSVNTILEDITKSYPDLISE